MLELVKLTNILINIKTRQSKMNNLKSFQWVQFCAINVSHHFNLTTTSRYTQINQIQHHNFYMQLKN